jgi:hypothetical protein
VQRPVADEPGRAPWRALSSVVVGLLFGLGAATFPLWSDQRLSTTATLGFVLFGLVFLAHAGAGLLVWFPRPRPAVRLTRVAGGDDSEPALDLRLGTGLPWARVLVGTSWTALGLWAVVAAQPGGLLLLPLLALPLALLPDAVRAIARRPHLVLTPSGLRLTGWAVDAQVAWDDVTGVDLTLAHARRAVVRLLLRPGAPSLRQTYHRVVQRLDGPRPDALDVPLNAVAQPGRLVALLRHLAASDPARRLEPFGPDAVPFLSGADSAAGP